MDFAAQFEQYAARYEHELLAHCYQMLGSVQDAEDLVQETLLRAWRARHRYDAALSSPRTWLHRIATNACINALEGRQRRPLPSQVVDPSGDAEQALVPDLETPWLQPIPSARLQGDPTDPANELVLRGRVRLAFTAALQVLAPRQRATLILRDVLAFSAAEVALMLDTSVVAVNSTVQRARARLARITDLETATDREPTAGSVSRQVVDQYVDAFLRADVAGLTRLLVADAVLEMPPVPLWYRGRELYGLFMERVFGLRGDDWRIVLTGANGQPALAAYARDGAAHRLHTLQVLTVTDRLISRNVVFQDQSVFACFDLPELLH